MTWVRKDIWDDQSPVILNGLRNIRDMNPSWHIEISDDHDVEQYLKNNLSRLDYKLLQHKRFVEKSDVWRLLKMLNEGGMYIDIDRPYNIPLDQILEPHTKLLLPTNADFDFSQDFMLSEPGCPIYQQALALNLQRRQQGWKQIYLLGAQSYMHAVTLVIMESMIECDPGAETFALIRSRIATMPFIKTYREVLPHDTMVYQQGRVPWQSGNGLDKKQWYAQQGVQHWAFVDQ